MRLFPELILDSYAVKRLCDEPTSSLRHVMPSEETNDTEPLHKSVHGDGVPSIVEFEEELASCTEEHEGTVCSIDSSANANDERDTTPPPANASAPSIDIGAQTAESLSPVSPSKDSNTDVSSLGKKKTAIEKTIKGAEKVVKTAVIGTKNLAEKTAKEAEKAAKKTAKETEIAVKKVKRETEIVVKKTTKEIAQLPHERASVHWKDLSLLLVCHVLGSIVLSLPTIMPRQASVNLGLEHNRGFVYGTHTLVEVFVLTAFISTCHYAIDITEIPLRARVTAFFVGLGVGKLALASIAEGWWWFQKHTLFPVPFSFVLTTVFGVISAVATLRIMTPKLDDQAKNKILQKKFKLLPWTLASYILAFLVSVGWGIVFRLLNGHPLWQSAWAVAIMALEFVCKILVTANLTTRLNPRKWIQLMLVVDLIFGGVQNTVLPFFASWLSVLISVLGTIGSIAWRAYGGPDRIKVFINMLKKTLSDSSSGAADKAKEVGAVGMQILQDSTSNIHSKSVDLLGKGQPGGLYEVDEELGEQCVDKTLERSGTADTEVSLEDSQESLDESIAKSERREPSTPGTVNMPAILESPQDDESQLVPTDGRQKHTYHLVDSISSANLVVAIRIQGFVTSALMRALVPQEELTASFQIGRAQYLWSIAYAWIFIISIILVVLCVGLYIAKRLKLGKLSLERVVSYVYRDSFWFFFFWGCCFQHLLIAIQMVHFGADFDCGFAWVRCPPGEMVRWP